MRRTATGLMILVRVNGPMNSGARLLQTVPSGIFLDESHTFCDLISQVSIEPTIFCGTINSGDDGRLDQSKTRDKASGLMFLEPVR